MKDAGLLHQEALFKGTGSYIYKVTDFDACMNPFGDQYFNSLYSIKLKLLCPAGNNFQPWHRLQNAGRDCEQVRIPKTWCGVEASNQVNFTKTKIR